MPSGKVAAGYLSSPRPIHYRAPVSEPSSWVACRGFCRRPVVVVEGTVTLGYPPSVIVPLGVILVAATVLYVYPRTAVLGAILLTGYLGGAVATHVRIGAPLFSHTLFPTYLGALLWGGPDTVSVSPGFTELRVHPAARRLVGVG